MLRTCKRRLASHEERTFEHYAICGFESGRDFGFNDPPVRDDLLPMNPVYFLKMAHGDAECFKELAFDYYNDTRRRMTGWLALLESGSFGSLRDDLHRCKGGASLFGLERLVAMIGASEVPSALETRGFDLAAFEAELSAAENAVSAIAESVP